MNSKCIIVFILLFQLFACKSATKSKAAEICCINTFSQKIERISLSDINRIKELHGKLIEVEGFYRYAFEETALCPSEHANSLNSLWVDLRFPQNVVPDSSIEEFRNKWITIIAKIDTSKKGHLGGYIGTLNSTICIKRK